MGYSNSSRLSCAFDILSFSFLRVLSPHLLTHHLPVPHVQFPHTSKVFLVGQVARRSFMAGWSSHFLPLWAGNFDSPL